MPDPPALTFCEPLPAPGVPRFVAPGQAAYAGSGMSVPFPENTIPRRRARRNLIPGRIRAGNGVSRGISRRRQVWWAGLPGGVPKNAADKHPTPPPPTTETSRSTTAARAAEYRRAFRETNKHLQFKAPPQGTLKTRYFSVYLACMRVKRFFLGFVLGVPGRPQRGPPPTRTLRQSGPAAQPIGSRGGTIMSGGRKRAISPGGLCPSGVFSRAFLLKRRHFSLKKWKRMAYYFNLVF